MEIDKKLIKKIVDYFMIFNARRIMFIYMELPLQRSSGRTLGR